MEFRKAYLYRLFFLAIAFLVSQQCYCQAKAPSNGIVENLKRAEFYLHRQHPDRAIILIDEALSVKPDDTRSLLLKSEAYLLIDKRQDAQVILNKILKSDSRNLHALVLRSKLNCLNRNLLFALTDANLAIKIAPRNSAGYIARAQIFGVFHRCKEAAADCALAQKLSPKNADVFRESAICLKNRLLGPEIKELFNTAISLSPADTRNYDSKASFLIERKFAREAFECTQAALKLDSDDGFALVNLANLMMMRRDYPKATACTDKAALAMPWSGWPLAVRGDIYASALEDESAIAQYSRAIRLQPLCAAFYIRRAIAFIGRRDFDKGLQDLTKAYALDSQNTYPLSLRADAYQSQGKWNEAEHDLSSILSRQPLNSDALLRRGLIFLKLNRPVDAAGDFDRAIFSNPASTTLEKRGEFYLLMHSYKKALSDFNSALKLDPKSHRAYRGLASAYEGLGKKDLASKALEASKGDVEGFLDQYQRASSGFSHLKNKLSK